MVKPNLTIVNPVQTHLGPVIQNVYPGGQLAVVVSNAYSKDMRPLPFAIDCELSKDSADLQETDDTWSGECQQHSV